MTCDPQGFFVYVLKQSLYWLGEGAIELVFIVSVRR
jgi:hypothetical protein